MNRLSKLGSLFRPVMLNFIVLVSTIVFILPAQAQCCDRDTIFGWDEGSNLRVFIAWNAPERAGGSYSETNWPRGALATNRALLFAARQVLRNEWDINNVIDTNQVDGFAQLADAETNYWQQHLDYPPQININYIWPDWTGHVNSHFYTTEDGKIRQAFVIWTVPGCKTGASYPAAGIWWPEIDESCDPVWYQRWTHDGAIELRLTSDAPIYRLTVSSIEGGLSSAQVYLEDKPVYEVNITEYDPINLRMVVQIVDYSQNLLTTETFSGTPEPWQAFSEHVTQQEALPPASLLPNPCTYVVSVNGTDVGEGHLSAPWRTVHHAAASARAGDTVCFKAGVWHERLEPMHSGTVSAPIVFTAYPGDEHAAVLDLEYMEGQDTYKGIIHIDSKSYITVKNLKITRSDDFGVFIRKSDHIVISNNLIDYTPSSGIYITSSRNVIADGNDLQQVTHRQGDYSGHESITILGGTDEFEISRNRIHNPFMDPETGEPISKEGIDAKDGVSNGTIHDNYVNLGNSIGIYIDGFDDYVTNVEVFNNELVGNSIGLVVASEQRGTVNGLKIYNNIIYRNRISGVRIAGWVNGGWAQNIDVVNNTVYENGLYGIEITNEEIKNITIVNNISLGHEKENLKVGGNVPASQLEISHNLLDSDADFVSAEGGDFYLEPGSPAIDAAASALSPMFDHDGIMRPIGPASDIGAYEAIVAEN